MLQQPQVIENFRELAQVHRSLGYCCDKMDDKCNAIGLYEKVLEILRQHLPERDSSLGYIYIKLSNVYRSTEEYGKVLNFAIKALNFVLLSPQPDQNVIIASYRSIGQLCCTEKRYEEALDMYDRVLERQKKLLPSNHPDIAQTYNDISQVYDSESKWDKSIEYLNKSLQPNHPSLATTYHNLSFALFCQRKLKDS
jgi:tetratricopeptide (TPR) repeat protein